MQHAESLDSALNCIETENMQDDELELKRPGNISEQLNKGDGICMALAVE
jgi:hypothetical protein